MPESKSGALTSLANPQKLIFENLAGDVGFEPTYVGFRIRCLNQLGESPVEPAFMGRRFGKRADYAFFLLRCQDRSFGLPAEFPIFLLFIQKFK